MTCIKNRNHAMSNNDALGKALKSSDYIFSGTSKSRDPHKSQNEIDQARVKLLSEGIVRLMSIYSASHEEISSAISLIGETKTSNTVKSQENFWPNHIPDITNCENNFNT